MDNIKIKFIALTSLIISVFIFIMYVPHVSLYDYNSMFSFLHLQRTSEKVEHDEYKVFPILLTSQANSSNFIDALYFIASQNPAVTVIDGFDNPAFFADRESFFLVEDFVNNNKSLISSTAISSSKFNGLIGSSLNRNKMLSENFKYIYSLSNFYLADSADIHFKLPSLSFPPERNTVYNIERRDGFFDILYKFDKRYSYTLPLMLFNTLNKNLSGDEIKFGSLSTGNGERKIYYDQRGRLSYNSKSKIDKTFSYRSYSDFYKALEIRKELISNLIKLGLVEKDENSYENYIRLESFIDGIYRIEAYKDQTKNALLISSNRLAAEWISFKKMYGGFINDAVLFISFNSDPLWINKSIEELYILENGEIIKRIPHLLVFFISSLFFLISVLLVFFFKRELLTLTALFAVNIILYFSFINFFRIDFPVFINFIFIIIGVLLAVVIKILYLVLWNSEVSKVLGENISLKYKNEISSQLRTGNIDFYSDMKTAGFLNVDISGILEYEKDGSDFILTSKILASLEAVIKNNYGVINNVTPSGISAYYGVPLRKDNYISDLLKTASDVFKEIDFESDIAEKINIGIHIKKEYFDLLKIDEVMRYRNIGSSINILNGMKVIANRFEAKIIVSSAVVKLSSEKLKVRMLDRIRIKGYENVERFFQYFTEEEYYRKEKLVDYFHAGLKLFEMRMWEEASYYFRQCLKLDESDVPSKIYLQRCKDFIYIPPHDEWDGVYEVE